jgi:hypothetical protein
VQAARQQPEVQTYLWFARFPRVTYREDQGRPIVEYQDIQFFQPMRANPIPFTLRVLFDAKGKVLSTELLEP